MKSRRVKIKQLERSQKSRDKEFKKEKPKKSFYGKYRRSIRIKASNIMTSSRINELVELAKRTDIPSSTSDIRKIRCFTITNENEVKLRELSLTTGRTYSDIIDILVDKYGIND